ncbi:MAG: M50 family metallopeptidase [Eubacteriales bacterium]|nr:M50 family metallopeptidase [Eubacteriales bacterium]
MNKFYIHPSTPFILIPAVLFGYFPQLIVMYLVAFVHELGHLLAALYVKADVRRLCLYPFGVTIELKEGYVKNPTHEIIVASAGPLTNSLIVLFSMLCIKNIYIRDFVAISSGIIGVMNLMPILPLDGGRVLKAILTHRWGFVKAFNFSVRISHIFTAILFIMGLLILIISRFNFSILLICVFITVNGIAEKRSMHIIVMRDVLYSKGKLSDGRMKTQSITVKNSLPARLLLKEFDCHKYFVIIAVDDNLKYCGTLTESQIIDGLVTMGGRVTIKELLDPL